VAALAGALAKAQAELTNPEKSLTATLPAERGQPERAFRYASLAGGLDIVRKTLGRHEIAVIQSTAIDRDAGVIRLTTTLAHASGEWIASDWPVCSLAELPAPRSMGAALSYARRYGLFTLVGIAGEDDLDAPDLALPPLERGQSQHGSVHAPPLSPAPGPVDGNRMRNQRAAAGGPATGAAMLLASEASLQQREVLLAEIAALASFDAAAAFAKRAIAIKNTLTADHAADVEAALRDRLDQLEVPSDLRRQSPGVAPLGPAQAGPAPVDPAQAGQSDAQGSVPTPAPSPPGPLPLGRAPRRRNKAHLKFVATQPCLLCGRQPSDPHHLKFAQPQALGRKVSDEFTVPLCRTHHRQLHRAGREAAWWKATHPDLDPLAVAQRLWEQSRDGKAADPLTAGTAAILGA
jgi:hypothetical protein